MKISKLIAIFTACLMTATVLAGCKKNKSLLRSPQLRLMTHLHMMTPPYRRQLLLLLKPLLLKLSRITRYHTLRLSLRIQVPSIRLKTATAPDLLQLIPARASAVQPTFPASTRELTHLPSTFLLQAHNIMTSVSLSLLIKLPNAQFQSTTKLSVTSILSQTVNLLSLKCMASSLLKVTQLSKLL